MDSERTSDDELCPAGVFLSVVITAHNEEGRIACTCHALADEFRRSGIDDYEILVVNDSSTDRTESILRGLSESLATVRYVNNEPPNGFGFAVRQGLDCYRGEAVYLNTRFFC